MAATINLTGCSYYTRLGVVMGHGPNASFTIQLDSFIALVDSGSGKVGEEQPVFSRSLSAMGDFGGGENNRSSRR